MLTFKILKQKLVLKYMSSQTGKLTISLNILPNISRRKDNQKIIFCQLIEYNMSNIFLQKTLTICGGEASP